jgi:hypothetical protein
MKLRSLHFAPSAATAVGIIILQLALLASMRAEDGMRMETWGALLLPALSFLVMSKGIAFLLRKRGEPLYAYGCLLLVEAFVLGVLTGFWGLVMQGKGAAFGLSFVTLVLFAGLIGTGFLFDVILRMPAYGARCVAAEA